MSGYDTPATNLVRDLARRHPDWEGELPPVMTREQLREQMRPFIDGRSFTAEQTEEFLDFMDKYEERYHEKDGKNYHRACGGGAMTDVLGEPICSRCGRLPDLLPPAFVSQ